MGVVMSYRALKIVSLLSLLIALSGCGEQKITGQVFVVTQGKDNIKLALVAVGAIPQKEFDQYLKAKQSKKLEQQKLLSPKYEQAKSRLLNSERGLESMDVMKKTNHYVPIKRQKADMDFVDGLITKFEAVRTECKAVIAEYESFDKTEFLFDGLPRVSAIAKTDADGKFTLSLPKGKYVLTANSSRKVAGSLEAYYWFIFVDSSSADQPIILSNDNLLETKCNECVRL